MDAVTFHPGEPMTDDEAWAHLAEESFGRLAYRLVHEVHIVPLDYVLDGGRIYFRSVAGNKLLAAALAADVAFEIDRRDGASAWSVVARGRLRRFDGAEPPVDFPPHPWLDGLPVEVVELAVETVGGRRFDGRDGSVV